MDKSRLPRIVASYVCDSCELPIELPKSDTGSVDSTPATGFLITGNIMVANPLCPTLLIGDGFAELLASSPHERVDPVEQVTRAE